MKKIGDLIKKLMGEQNTSTNRPNTLDDRELLCRNIRSTLDGVIEDINTTKGKQLIVWLNCDQRIFFDQYNNESYRDIILKDLLEHGYKFEQMTFIKGEPEADNHNVFKICDNDLEYLEVSDCDVAQQSSVAKKAKIVIIEGLYAVNPLQKEYELSSEEITSGRIPAYNIGRGKIAKKDGVFRENHIIFDVSSDSPLREEYRCISRNHAHIGFDPKKGFFFQVDEGGAYPGKTLLVNEGRTINCDCPDTVFPLKNGAKIIVKDGMDYKAMLVFEQIKN